MIFHFREIVTQSMVIKTYACMILYEMDGASTIQGFFLTKFQSIKLNRNQKIKTQCSGTFFLEKICKNINKTQNYMFKNFSLKTQAIGIIKHIRIPKYVVLNKSSQVGSTGTSRRMGWLRCRAHTTSLFFTYNSHSNMSM